MNNSILRADLIGVIQAVMIGASFLDSSTLTSQPERDRVNGLTTAATLLVVARIGNVVASGLLLLARGATVLVLIALRGIRWLEQRKPVERRRTDRELVHAASQRHCTAKWFDTSRDLLYTQFTV